MEFFLSGEGDQALPFELQAFEVPLAAAVRMFESECNALENKLLPSLERLTAKVNTQQATISLSAARVSSICDRLTLIEQFTLSESTERHLYHVCIAVHSSAREPIIPTLQSEC